jgi:uncharacterized protein (DUF1778 family)
MARREPEPLTARISPTFPKDIRELIHLASQILDTTDTAFVRDAAHYRAAVTVVRGRMPEEAPNLEGMYADLSARFLELLGRVEVLEQQLRELQASS